ncbi:MAG: YihY/virulence factor BrkB family protein [Clostridia bacterium]|nr:YihY/virulence factor BrkB family protein [Clostridia bacterium]
MKRIICDIIRIVKNKRITTVAGAWVFYFLTALLPLVFLLVTAFGIFGVDLSNKLISNLPTEFMGAGKALIETAQNASKTITLFFIITILFSGSALLNQMSKDGEFIYGAKLKNGGGLFRRLFSVVALGILFFCFLGVAFIVAFGSKFFLNIKMFTKRTAFTLILTTVIILSSFLIIMFIQKFISPIKIKFRNILIGSFVSLFIIVIGTLLFTLYLRLINNYNAFYGSLASIVVFLLWSYIVMFGLIVGAIVIKKINQEDC